MKKNSRLKSFFAILLAVSMIFQQSSLTVLATDDTYVEDATATPTPSENEAETYATEGAEPVAEKQEEPQQVQETPAAEQAQEPTEAPAEQPTEAPAEQPTEAPAAAPTETPATEPTAAPAAEMTEVPAAPEATATPAAEATATPTPEVSASPSETPTPTPTETPKTSFRYEDSRVVITATAPEDANLPQDAEIKADYIAPGTERYNAAVAAFNSQLSSQLGLDAENMEAEYVLYDVYFLTADGSRIEPESGNVKVDMSFKQIQESTVDGDVVNKDVVHLDNDGQAEVVTEYVNTNADGEITSMGFTQDSFSIVGGVTTYDVETSGGEGNSENALKLDAYITNVIIQDANQQTITSLTETTTESKRTESFNLVGYFGNIPVDELEKHGWKVEYQIPEQDKIKLEEPTSGTIKNGSNEVIGNYRITTDGFVSMEFDKDKLGHGTAVGGNFTCWAYLDCTDITTTGDVTLKFNDKVENNVTIRVNKKEQLEIKKVAEVPVVNYENNEITYTYTVKVSSPTGTVKSIDFVDKLEKWSSDANLSWSSLTIECNDPLVSVASDCLTISTENKTISGTLPCLPVGGFYTITYKITEKFNEPVNGKFSENNTAKAKTNPSGKLEDLIEVEAKSNPEVNYTSKDYKDVVVDKKGTGVQGDDGKITWTYTVTVSSPHGTGDEIDFKDQLKSDAKGTSRKVKSDSLSVKKKTNTAPDGTNVTSENYLKVSGDELLKADSTAVSGKLPALNAGESYEITYQVEESGFTESNFTANGKNTAYAKVTEKVKDEHSSEPTINIYNGIPTLKKDGNYDAGNKKINWTIEANGDNNKWASLEGYEVSDTLLQNDIQQNIIAKVMIQKTGWGETKWIDNVKLPVKFYTSNGKPYMKDDAGTVTELYTIKDYIKIEYSTTVPDDYYVKYNNTANIKDGDGNKEEKRKDVDIIKPIVTKEDALVTKNESSDTVNLAWTTSIIIPNDGIKTGSYFEDYLDNAWNGSEPESGSWFTKDQLENMTVTGINKSDYTITYIQTENNADYFKGFKIKFNKEISYSEVKKISLSYSSTGYVGDLKAGEKKEFVNEAKFTQDGKTTSDKGKGSFKKESVVPKVDKTNFTEDGSVKDAFYSCNNDKKVRIYYRVVVDTKDLMDDIVYTDTFPNYGTLVTSEWAYGGKECNVNNFKDGIMVRYLSADNMEVDNLREIFGNIGFDYYPVSKTQITKSNGSFTATISRDVYGIEPGSERNWFASYGERPKLVLYYAIDYDLNSAGLTEGNACVITNNGTVTAGGKSDSSSAKATVEMSKVSKSSAGYHDDTNTISYAVTINPAGEELLDGNNLTVTDALNYTDHVNDVKGISLIPGSAKLYRRNADGSRGEDITPNGEWISVTDANGVCTLVTSIPDKTACILEYKYLFEYKNISRKDYLISNTAVVSGEANKKWTSTVSTQLKDQGSDVIANTESTMLTLVKRDSQNAALFLEGAVYKLEKYNGTKWVTVGENYTTDKNGVVQLGEEINGKIVMKYNYAYRLTEIKAPNNYKRASEPIYIYLKEASSSVSYKPTGFDESKALGSNGGYIYVSDEKDLTEKISIPVEKRWVDADNKEGLRPSKITVVLTKNGIETKTTLELSAANNWKDKFSKLDKFDSDGALISYGIKEIKVNYYPESDVTGDATTGFVVTNKRTPETINVSGKKTWDDNNNQDGKRPAKITIQLQADGVDVTGKTAELTGDTVDYSWDNLPKYADGKEIKYTVREVGETGGKLEGKDGKTYDVEYSGMNVKNSYTSELVDIEGAKNWNDNGNADIRPETITINLYANGKFVASKTVTKADDWKWKFENQPKYENGQEIEYTITEDKVDGYITAKGTGKYDVINTPTKVTIEKVDALGTLLPGATFEIQDKDGMVIDTWTTSTKDNPHVITGKLILGETYKLVEKSAPSGYTLADPVEFTVSEKDTDNRVEMKNTYSASGNLNLTAKKTLTTTETPLAADQFTFELRDKDGKVLQTKTNDADGNVTFDEIKYSLVKDAAYKDNTDKKVDNTGEYQYTVNEVKGDAAGYTYDDTIYTINVTVTDAGNGTLTVTPVIHSSKATSEDATVTGMEFTNTYTTSGQIALGATKTLEGQTLEAEQFSFQATEMDADGKTVENGYSETVKNADGGAITFPIITYKQSGTHYYQITEVKDEKPAYQYDESKYVVKVDVTDDNAGKLTAKVTSVTKNGEPVKSEDLTGAVTFTNTYSASADLELKAQKSMKVEAEQLGTFEFELKDADGKVIETVKNDEKGAISFSKLSYTEKDAGKTFTYTVNEKLPSEADTYVYDKTVYTVTVNVEDNRDGTLKLTTKVNGEDYTETAMKFINDTTKVTISKVDDTTLKALAGAKLQVVDDQDKVVEEWTSDGTPHVLTAKLVLGKTYKLVEAEAPSGYEIAEPITFTVDADDTKNAVEMKDAMIKSKTAAIEITKELKLNDALAGAKDMTFYAALFADAECTIPASDVKALEFKNASSSTVTFTNLDLGRTYYVSETDVTGKAIDSGMTPDEKVYVPVYPQGQAITVTEDGAKSSITFENQFSEWPDGFYKIATLNVTKKLLGADGNALESDEIFYAGIFDDKECTTLSTRTEKNILTLDLAGGSTVSESTQAVVIPDEAFTLYVAETDAEGNLVDGTDGFRYAVTVENGNVLFDENNLNAEVTIINQEQPEATPTVTPEETITPTPTPGTSTGVKTGDDTPIGFYMALLFIAALAIEETTRRRRKKEQD